MVEAVKLTRQHGLLVAVRGGGHSVAGHSSCDGGMVIDLTRMRGVDVDPEARHAGAGEDCSPWRRFSPQFLGQLSYVAPSLRPDCTHWRTAPCSDGARVSCAERAAMPRAKD